MREHEIDCVVLDLKLPDMTGMEVMQKMSEEPKLAEIPVVVFTGRELTPAQESQLQDLARTVVLKGVESPERLLDETALFLHRDVGNLPQAKQRLLERLRQSNASLMGRKVLVVDDDVRNIFALGNLLERHGMNVLTAQTGPEAIATLQGTPDIAVVLMDIMMPGMDGYETMRLIRQSPGRRRLPIIAVTAKAMKGDREKCLEAGASDYLAKPVDTEQLLAMLRLWLHR
jgi:CheY-like chemotaxis protein